MPKNKHLSLAERYAIEHSLKKKWSFKAMARELQRDCTTISKEVRNHRVFKKTGDYGHSFNDCIHRSKCDVRNLCDPCPNKRLHFCSYCKHCIPNCPDYKPHTCPRREKPPYVCNGCNDLRMCFLEKAFYRARDAQNEYELVRTESHSGINISEQEALHLDHLISPLIQKGQSIHHICTHNRDKIMHSEKTIYNYIDLHLFSALNVDLPRKVRYRPRKLTSNHYKIDKLCRVGRTYDDFLFFTRNNPDLPIVEMDTVLGTIGGKVLLTIHFIKPQLMLAYLRDANDSQSVIDIFDDLYMKLQPDLFVQLCPVLLGDNGSEFSNPKAIEYDKQGNRRTSVFYCDPSSPYQKGAVENNHEFIRRILPKGTSFDTLTQEDINLMMHHINSYSR